MLLHLLDFGIALGLFTLTMLLARACLLRVLRRRFVFVLYAHTGLRFRRTTRSCLTLY